MATITTSQMSDLPSAQRTSAMFFYPYSNALAMVHMVAVQTNSFLVLVSLQTNGTYIAVSDQHRFA